MAARWLVLASTLTAATAVDTKRKVDTLPVYGAVVGSVQVARGALNTPEAFAERSKGKVWDEDSRAWVSYNLLDEARAGSTARGRAMDGPQPIDVGGLRRRAGPEQRRRARDLGVRVALVVAQRGREVRLLAAREEERRAAAGLVEGVGVHALRDELLDLVDVPVPRGLVDREQRRRRRRHEERVLHPDSPRVALLEPHPQRRAATDVGHLVVCARESNAFAPWTANRRRLTSMLRCSKVVRRRLRCTKAL